MTHLLPIVKLLKQQKLFIRGNIIKFRSCFVFVKFALFYLSFETMKILLPNDNFWLQGIIALSLKYVNWLIRTGVFPNVTFHINYYSGTCVLPPHAIRDQDHWN